jgi:ATP-dependent HslUV protease subunit HslV
MTTIAYRNGELAADTLCTIHTHRDGYVTKIAKRGELLCAACGTWPTALKFIDWFKAGLPASREPDMSGGNDKEYGASGHIFRPDGMIIGFSNLGWTWKRAPYYALGSGADYCYGAFSMGATAEQAVRAALEHETASGGDVTVLRHFG